MQLLLNLRLSYHGGWAQRPSICPNLDYSCLVQATYYGTACGCSPFTARNEDNGKESLSSNPPVPFDVTYTRKIVIKIFRVDSCPGTVEPEQVSLNTA